MLEQLKKPEVNEEIAVLNTNLGSIKLRLFPKIAPKAVENFTTHIKNGYYDDVIFHRVIPEFMIQGGDPTGTGRGGKSIYGKNFEDEFHPKYRNFVGALSMANAGPNTNGSQFFIMQGPADVGADLMKQMKAIGEDGGFSPEIIETYSEIGGAPWLDGRHTVFGQVIEGMDIVNKIVSVKRNALDRPIDDVVIESATIEVYNE